MLPPTTGTEGMRRLQVRIYWQAVQEENIRREERRQELEKVERRKEEEAASKGKRMMEGLRLRGEPSEQVGSLFLLFLFF